MGGDDDARYVLGGRVEGRQHVGAHIKVDLAADQEQPTIGLRPTRQNAHVEPVARIGPIRDGLIEAAVLGLRAPVGRESHLVQRERRGADGAQKAEDGKQKRRATPSPARGRRWPREAGSDEGRRRPIAKKRWDVGAPHPALRAIFSP